MSGRRSRSGYVDTHRALREGLNINADMDYVVLNDEDLRHAKGSISLLHGEYVAGLDLNGAHC